MKKALILLLVLLTALALAGCAEDADVAGDYRYEGEGFVGDFTLTIHDDGTFRYYEGMASSYIGLGSWAFEQDVLTLTDSPIAQTVRVNRFAVEDGGLTFIEEGSDNFLYLKLADGARFLPDPPTTE